MTKFKNIYCVPCGKKSKCKLTTGEEIYPAHMNLWQKRFYVCQCCGNYVGVHEKTGIPLGSIPTPALRLKRRQIHSVLDPMWQKGKFKRRELYNEISERFGRRYHTAKVNSLEESEQVLQIIEQIKRGVI